MNYRWLLRTAILTSLALAPALAQKSLFDIHALLQMKRVGEAQVSPDSKLVAFTVSQPDIDKNSSTRQIWIVPIDGGVPRAITTEGRNERPMWSPDSKKIAFTSTRSGASQIWVMDPDGSNARQVTTIATEASNQIWTPDGKSLVFNSEVYPDCPDPECNARRLKLDQASKVKARAYTSLLYRHWNEWRGPRRKHIFIASLAGGTPKDLTPGPLDVPPFSLGGGEDFVISPDGKELCYVSNIDPNAAFSTNGDIFVVSIEGGEAKKISTSLGNDLTPQYSPDGKYIAWRSQEKAGFEADRWKLVLHDRSTGVQSILTENIDRNVNGFAWHPDSQRIAILVEDRGRQNAQLIPVLGGGARQLTNGGTHIQDISFTSDGKRFVYVEDTGASPAEIYVATSGDRSPRALARLNEGILAQYDLRRYEEFTVDGAEGAKVQSFLLKPPGFDPSKKYPVLVLIHGGPQSAWTDSFSYRWNPQVFSAAGFVIVMPNPRGSTGFGQKFTDDISGDWGGKAFDDIMAAVDYVAKLPYVDADRMAAAGGSYGGYMINWLLGHTNRFKALVSHAGVYDLRSMAGATEELWFTEWEFKGMPWQNPEMYEKWSPSVFAKDFKTPTLVIHGELDYRVPYTQGLQLFTALQAQKIPSKLLVYPDEGHWILKPQNSELWYKTFLDWVTEWTAKK
jgi:dipeptidyl aminopeptidase/acylaminoacyl peptidase